MKESILVIGAGGHASVLVDALLTLNHVEVIGLVDLNLDRVGQSVLGINIIGDEKLIQNYSPEKIKLVNGIGSITIPERREVIYRRFKSLGYTFFSVIHPHAYVAKQVILGEGVQIMAGSVLQTGCVIGANSIVNTRTSVDHDCHIAEHVHLAPGVTLSGNVHIDTLTHVGTSATILQGIKIGNHCLIGAGSLVNRNIPNHSKVIGVPAKPSIQIMEDLVREELA